MSDKINEEEKTSIAPETEESAASSPEKKVELLANSLAEKEKELLYLRAEFDNFRKQSIKERSQLVKYAGESIVRDLLTTFDTFEKALEMEINQESFKAFVDGVLLTHKDMKNTLEKHGIKEIECEGKIFDPQQAEALSQSPSKEVAEGHVLAVMRKGYTYHDKVLRHAQVVLASTPAEEL